MPRSARAAAGRPIGRLLALVLALALAAPAAAPAGRAAPPDAGSRSGPSAEADGDDATRATQARSRRASPATAVPPGTRPEAPSETAAASAAVSSLRPRGAAAPVTLRSAAAPVVANPSRDEAGPASPPAEREAGTGPWRGERRSEASARVWPLRAGDFAFTQAFGCVPQIGGFYRSDPGCPGDAPVVHTGIDLAAPAGTRFYAAASGWVTEAGLDRPEGLANTRIIVQHDGPDRGYATEYLHWIASFVEAGDYVEAGQPIGEVGSVGYSTGPHLHFAVVRFEDGTHLDPLGWLPEDRRSGAYAGLAPDARATRFENKNAGVPDYADPSPPPLPREEPVPEQAQIDRRDERTRERSKQEREDRRERRSEGSAPGEDAATEPGSDDPGGGDDRGRDGERKAGRGRDNRSDRGSDPAQPEPEPAEFAATDERPSSDRQTREQDRRFGGQSRDRGDDPKDGRRDGEDARDRGREPPEQADEGGGAGKQTHDDSGTGKDGAGAPPSRREGAPNEPAEPPRDKREPRASGTTETEGAAPPGPPTDGAEGGDQTEDGAGEQPGGRDDPSEPAPEAVSAPDVRSAEDLVAGMLSR